MSLEDRLTVWMTGSAAVMGDEVSFRSGEPVSSNELPVSVPPPPSSPTSFLGGISLIFFAGGLPDPEDALPDFLRGVGCFWRAARCFAFFNF